MPLPRAGILPFGRLNGGAAFFGVALATGRAALLLFFLAALARELFFFFMVQSSRQRIRRLSL